MDSNTQRAIDAFTSLTKAVKRITRSGCDRSALEKLYKLEGNLVTANKSVRFPSLPAAEQHALEASAAELIAALDDFVKGIDAGTIKVRGRGENLRTRVSEYYKALQMVMGLIANRPKNEQPDRTSS